jgi:cytochrome c553
MFHLKSKITAGLALAFLVTSSASFAADKAKKTTAQATPVAAQTSTTSGMPAADYQGEAALSQRGGGGDKLAGDDKAALCKGCHGEEGVSTEPLIPKLAGQYGKYIAKQVRNYQAGIRTHQIMGAVAATITEDELTDIGAFFANRPMMNGGGAHANNQLGKDLFLNGDMSRMLVACVNCHGVNGKGKTPDNAAFPVIGGQHKEYLMGQLVNFRLGDRSNSPGGVMNIMVQRLNDVELEALADYISGL